MNFYSKLSLATAVLPLLAGCVDDKYDLNDVDTTVKVNVDNLVIPVNIDRIEMGSIIDLDDDDIVKIVDGEYAIVQEGTFDSEDINVPRIFMPGPVIASTDHEINLINTPSTGRASSFDFSYDISTTPSAYSYRTSSVSDFIVSIDRVGCDITFDINVAVIGLEQLVNRITFSDLIIQIPKGLTLTDNYGGTYNPATGELTLPDITTTNSQFTLTLKASAIDFAQIGGVYNYEQSTIQIDGNVYIKEGTANVMIADFKPGITQLRPTATLHSSFNLSDCEVTSFTGKVKYNISGANLTSVDLSNLPDVLSQSSTDLKFANPQVYLQITNPLQAYNVYARTGLEILAYHSSATTSGSFSLNDPWFQIGPSNADGIYNFVMSPAMPASIDPAFPGATHVEFTSLSNVLSGDGIPSRLDIELVNPELPVQQVTDFRLGRNLGALHGKYKFFAPLNFLEGSTITYTDRIDGWQSEDLDHMTITALEISLAITTNIPVKVSFTGYPIDADGHRIGNVEILGAEIDANATDQKVNIYITGEITGLDGIEFVASATAIDGSTLSPDMSVTVSDIRPKVSGYYQKEL